MHLLLKTAEDYSALEGDLEGRIEVLEDDGAEEGGDLADLHGILAVLREKPLSFPAHISLDDNFGSQEREQLLRAVENCRDLDPDCGIAIVDDALAAIALPMVQQHLESEAVTDCIGPLSVEFHQSGPLAEIHYIIVPVKNGTIADNVRALALALTAYCTNEDRDALYVEPTFTLNGREWMIGDGDDGGAVVFQGGAFRLWLRSFTS